jgi:hypothetical protein
VSGQAKAQRDLAVLNQQMAERRYDELVDFMKQEQLRYEDLLE